jgi:hypothetical protein
MYQGKQRLKTVHFKLPTKEGACPPLEEMLNDPRINVLSIHYAHNSQHNEKWALVIYEEL